MRKWLLSLAIVAMVSAPAFAGLGPLVTFVNPDGHRPTVDADGAALLGTPTPIINWARWAGATGGRYDLASQTVANVAGPSSIISWAGWAKQTGVANNWAVYGGAPLGSGLPINVEDLSTGAIIGIPEVNSQNNYGYTDVNANGDVVWIGWPDNTDPIDTTQARIRHANVAAPGVITTLGYGANQGEGGQRMRISSDSDRVIWRDGPNDGSKISLYDLGDAAQYTVFLTDGDQKAYHNGLDDSGNWSVTNMRSAVDGTTNSDIVLLDLTNPNVLAPLTYLTGDGSLGAAPTHVRNDPSMDMITNDMAIVVWGDNASGSYAIKGMFVTGLSVNAPVAGPEFLITNSGNFPDVDYDSAVGMPLVTWLIGGGATIGYRYIPEPATLALLGLGVLALARRR